MADVQEKIKGLLSMMGGGSEQDRLKMLLYYGDLSGEFADDDDWGGLCEFAIEVDEEVGGSDPYLARYSELVQKGKHSEALSAMVYDLRDNKIFAAMAIHRAGLPSSMALVPAAAYNKHAYQGLKDEFAVTRFLVWSGFDINQPNPATGMTALHKFASTQVMPGSHPRAVQWLLEHGADVHAVNANGDTALAFLCATEGWGEAQDQTFELLLEAGSNPFVQSKDGQTPFSLLAQLNEREPSELRTARLEQLRGFIRKLGQVGKGENGSSDDEEGDEGDEGEESSDEADLTPSQRLAQVLLMLKQRVSEIRDFYHDEEAIEKNKEEAGLQAWDERSGEQYLKRIYQVTLGFAIRNCLFGRREFYSDEVAEVFQADPDFAFLFDPSHVLPLMDSFRKEFAAKAILGIPRIDQKAFAEAAMRDWKSSANVQELVSFPSNEGGEDPLDVDDLLIGGQFGKLEAVGFGPVARAASLVHLSVLFETGWGDPFMGLRRQEVGIPNELSTRVAVHIINRHKVRDGVEGRALGFAFQSYAMQLSKGLLSGPALLDDSFSDDDEDGCIKAMGSYCGQLPVIWGLSESAYPEGEDATLEPVEIPKEFKGLVEALREQFNTGGAAASMAQGKEAAQVGAAESDTPKAGDDGSSSGPPPDDVQATAPMPLQSEAHGEVEIPPELLEAARVYREKGGPLRALGRWAYKPDPARPNKLVELDREWALRRMGTPEGERIIAKARAKAAKDKGI